MTPGEWAVLGVAVGCILIALGVGMHHGYRMSLHDGLWSLDSAYERTIADLRAELDGRTMVAFSVKVQ